MKYMGVNIGEFFKFSGYYFIKIDDGGSVIISPRHKGTIIDFDLDEEVVPVDCNIRFTKREE